MAGTSARDKLVETATRLFYDRGISATGVDTVVAQSGVSKPTLYAHFRSKQDLVVEVLARQHDERRASLEAHLNARESLSPNQRVLAVFDWIEAHQRGAWARGCPFVNMSVELGEMDDTSAQDVTRRHKTWFRGRLRQLIAATGAKQAARLASQLHLLIEGANVRMLAEADRTAIKDARRAAAGMLPPQGGRKPK